jgi:hypothetical protein
MVVVSRSSLHPLSLMSDSVLGARGGSPCRGFQGVAAAYK